MDEKHRDMTTLQEKVPPLDDLIHKDFGSDRKKSSDELKNEISERGRHLSATECCEYFCTPPTKDEIKALAGQRKGTNEKTIQAFEEQGSAIIPKDHGALIDAILSVGKEQIVIISENLFPKNLTFLKHDTALNVERPRNLRYAPLLDEALRKAIKKVKLEDEFSGFDFQGATYYNKTFRLISLIDVIRGCIYDASLHTAVNIGAYAGAIPLETGGRAGAMQIPSFHCSGREYLAGLAGIPIYRKGQKHTAASKGYDVTTLSLSPRELWDVIKFNRKIPNRDEYRHGPEQRWDHHTILVYERAAKKFAEDGWEVMRPYPEPSAETIQFYWKLLHHCLVQECNPKEQGCQLEHLKIAQAEYLLWKYIGWKNDRRQK